MGTVLYSIIITPIELFIEIVFNVMNLAFKNPGFAIIFVSIAVQLLCFPLYKRADEIQEQERQKQKEMEHWLNHIKKTFKGDERFMMQQTYYRSVNYKPIYAIKGSVSLLLQIPFFIAAYNFLSHLETLKQASFLGIADLSQPDQLIHIGSLTLNLLPILMTFFNIISGIIYTRGFPLKDKIQTYGLACIFLVILYKSPSGLVFYWTLNNFFSLLKNVFMKLVKNPKKVIRIILLAIGIIAPVYVCFFSGRSVYLKLASLAFAFVCLMPTVIYIIKKHIKSDKNALKEYTSDDVKHTNALFYSALALIFVLVGCFIPVQTIKASPVEFISLNYGPFGLIFYAVCVYIGILFVWINIFYIFSSTKTRKIFAVAASIAAIAGVVNYMFFGKGLGTISICFLYDKYPEFSMKQLLINTLISVFIALAVAIICSKKSVIIKNVNRIAALALAVSLIIGSVSIEKVLADEGHPERAAYNTYIDKKIIPLNKNGKNVIVFMLDRAISGFFPFALNDEPQIKEIFDGFTYYPNTISFGGYTNYATPALFGGYEYTPTEINKRPQDTLVSKHNESIMVLPQLFADNKFDVTVVDIPYVNYQWKYNTSIYGECKDINAYNIIGHCKNDLQEEFLPSFEASQKRSMVFFSLMRSAPLFTQNTIYQSGSYWASSVVKYPISTFINSYSALGSLTELTNISEKDKNTFLMIQNDVTHYPIFLDESDYSIFSYSRQPDFRVLTLEDGSTLDISYYYGLMLYQTFKATLLEFGKWISYLKEQGVYDNTKIILVSDHGEGLGQFKSMLFESGVDVSFYNPLLLVKDYNSSGFSISQDFMTNADTPTLAVRDTIENPVNPFTGKLISNSEKYSHPQIITTSTNGLININNGNVFDTSDGEWWEVKDNIFDEKNWKKVEGN